MGVSSDHAMHRFVEMLMHVNYDPAVKKDYDLNRNLIDRFCL